MKLYEYQGRELFRAYGIPCVEGAVVATPEEAAEAAVALGGPVVIKAQVLAGGRGKAGGVKLAGSPEEAGTHAENILGLTIKGIPVERLLVVPAADIEKEYYVGLTVDRNAKALTLMVSAEGGVDIEALAETRPEAIKMLRIAPADGLDDNELSVFLAPLFPTEALATQAAAAVKGLFRLFIENDCSLAEINPYAQVAPGEMQALDSKVVLDDNGLVKHPELEALRNSEEYSADEIKARAAGLSYVSMDGEIGCIVNGAGLAMGTMDLIKHFGGTPANFLDVGGSSNPDKVLNALEIITGNPRVRAILINIFGGITRCDDIARGLVMATEQMDLKLPMVIRLIGTNDREGRELLDKAGLASFEDLSDSVKRVVALAAESATA